MYTVRWVASALNDLADVWINANSSQRQAIASATNEIDRLLGANPQDQGESRDVNQRIMFSGPLGLVFEIREDDKTVRVLGVWRIDKARGGG